MKNERMIFQTDETRKLILDTAWKIFLKQGFFDAQMKDVAEATRLTRTSLYRYFQDKTELAMALVERAAEALPDGERWREALDESGRPLPGLEAVRRALEERWLSPQKRDIYVFLAEFDAYFSGSRIPPGFNTEVSRALGAGEEDNVLLSLIKLGMRDGSVRTDIDPHLTFVTLVNSVRGLQQRLLLRGRTLVELRQGELERMSAALVDLLIAGLRPRKEG